MLSKPWKRPLHYMSVGRRSQGMIQTDRRAHQQAVCDQAPNPMQSGGSAMRAARKGTVSARSPQAPPSVTIHQMRLSPTTAPKSRCPRDKRKTPAPTPTAR